VGFHEKPAGLACPKLCQSGCSIYQQRPKLCKEFECTWLANKDWPEAWRPDRSGLFCLQEEVARDIRIGLIYELETEALGTDLAEEIIGTLLARSVAVVLVDRHGHRRTTINRAYAEEIENFGQDAGGGPSRESHFTAWLRAKMAGTAPASPERRAA